MPLLLAVIRQESSFRGDAASRHSSARGFAQALDATWKTYRKATDSPAAKRNDFADSVDFIAWYVTQSRKRVGLPVTDVVSHYLAYHEGHAGFRSARWQEKPRLLDVAGRVAETASLYAAQLRTCPLALPEAPSGTPAPMAKVDPLPAPVPRSKPDEILLAMF